ncbi:hypothetical protein [Natrarchaeobaculum sulfurireducens]|uniref:Uncharacterized protein n=1 Tax=Natrarchaeobaculum sulfurireducens TaxID=2044521 RepID=A0A346P9S1_9EURY|nr:hypothetical protein [Natrarchaeobaculum sulfurireducens]AXR76266.1 hypothetical protein AArc1_5065 [Natrarchaeobaculum sulfurireducens]AXR79835.1 hypothetical protein AArcMg_4010 [Natrarchaeobaculum sulfurireducens]
MASKYRDLLVRAGLPWFGGMLAWIILTYVSLWKVRLHGARISRRFPGRLVPKPFRVLPPPDSEYVGVWDVSPATARDRLIEDYDFSQMIRAYLHAYERDGTVLYEVASCSYRPSGVFGRWQLHVRLFPTPEGKTDVWCHWELNPNVAPIAHLRQEGYDPEEGERRLRELLENVTFDRVDDSKA